jgi:hypothetical protein
MSDLRYQRICDETTGFTIGHWDSATSTVADNKGNVRCGVESYRMAVVVMHGWGWNVNPFNPDLSDGTE